jgi:hypothetical protein
VTKKETPESIDFYGYIREGMIRTALEQGTTTERIVADWRDARLWRSRWRRELPRRPSVPDGVEQAKSAYHATFHIPNENSHRAAGMGVLSGVSDYFCAWPAFSFSGLWLEMKRTKGGRTSKQQRWWLDFMREIGYAGRVVKGAVEAISVWEGYVHGRLIEQGGSI